MFGAAIAEEIGIQSKVNQITALSQELYQEASRQITPAKGWVLLRVLPKEHMRNGIILPSQNQHKPLYEAIVLTTWEPYQEEKTVVDEQGRKLTKIIQHESQLAPGDHVLFEHWAGVPLETDQKAHSDYRLVKEAWKQETGGILSVITHDEGDTKPHAQLVDAVYIALADGGSLPHDEAERLSGLISAQIEHKFLLVDKTQRSVTLTGN